VKTRHARLGACFPAPQSSSVRVRNRSPNSQLFFVVPTNTSFMFHALIKIQRGHIFAEFLQYDTTKENVQVVVLRNLKFASK